MGDTVLMVSPPEVTERPPSGRWAPHQTSLRLLGVSLVVLSLVIWWRELGNIADDPPRRAVAGCSSPAAAEVADWGTSSTLVVQARFDTGADLDDGTTATAGWRVTVRSVESTAGGALDPALDPAGSAAEALPASGEPIDIWPGPKQGTPRPGESLILWVNAHQLADQGEDASYGYDAVGVLAVMNDRAQRVCPGSRSAAVPLDDLR